MNKYNALKLSVVQSFTRKNLAQYPNAQNELDDALATSWFLSHQEPTTFGLQNEAASNAEALQWLYYGQSEISPFLGGYLHHARSGNNTSRDVAFQQKQRACRLKQALNRLDDVLRSKTFLVNDRCTIADTHLAIDMLPLFVVKISGRQLIQVICPSERLAHLQRWHRTVLNQPSFSSVYSSKSFEENIEAEPAKKKAAPVKDDGGKLKILCLHGYRQTAASFYEKLGAFRKLVGRKCVLRLLEAPHLVPPETNEAVEQVEQRGWWFSRPHGYFKSTDVSDCDQGLEESLKLINTTIQEEGPFDGLMGFSQGAALAAILCLMPELASKFRFAWLFAPFASVCSKHAHFYEESTEIPTLFVIGQGDQVVAAERGQALMACFKQGQAVLHDGGHFVPATSKQKAAYLSFLEQFNQG